MSNEKDNVYKVYDKITDWFDTHRSRELFEKPWLDKAMSYLKPGACILDLGCGMGEPIARYFIEQGFDVMGIDGSEKQIDLAKTRLPQGQFRIADMRDLNLGEKFDLVIAWHSFFHLPQDDQRAMFETFANHLNKGGILLFTSGPDAGEVWGENGGENLYHASLSPSEYKDLLSDHGFSLLDHKIEDNTCGDATIWMAQLNCVTANNQEKCP